MENTITTEAGGADFIQYVTSDQLITILDSKIAKQFGHSDGDLWVRFQSDIIYQYYNFPNDLFREGVIDNQSGQFDSFYRRFVLHQYGGHVRRELPDALRRLEIGQ